ncbi:MAG: hypothetical protein ABEI32_09120 [Halothece sp.]
MHEELDQLYYQIDLQKEPTLTSFGDEGWISVNDYDARCLNTARLWFCDTDYSDLLIEMKKDAGEGGKHLGFDLETAINYYRKFEVVPFDLTSDPPKEASGVASTRRMVDFLKPRLPHGLIRLYLTCKGFRILWLNPLAPRSRDAVSAMSKCVADRRYMSLSVSQNCYRARLSPKPWRGVESNARTAYRFGDYRCTVKDLGIREVHPTTISNREGIEAVGKEAVRIIKHHDRETRANVDQLDLPYLA